MNLTIRQFCAADERPLRQIYHQIYKDSALSSHYFKQQAEWCAKVNGRFLILTHHNESIGYISAFPMPGLPHLYELAGFVAPAYQRRGFGTRLLTRLCQSLRGTNARHLTYGVPHTQTSAAHFLRQQQFFIEHEEWQMELSNLQAHPLRPTSHLLRPLSSIQFCKLYDNSFSQTAWYQPFTTIEVLSIRHENDQLRYFEVNETATSTSSSGRRSVQAVGFVWLRYPTAKTAEIEPIGIIKNEQGKGYGRLLLQQVLYQLQQQGIQQVHLGVWANNQIAIHLYHQFGFHHQNTTMHLMFNLI